MKRRIRLISCLTVMVLLLSACGKKDEDKGFVPKLPSDYTGQISVSGNYSNFEALEKEFERFAVYYPNVEMNYTMLDSYASNIGLALLNDDPPDIYFTFTWMVDKELYPIRLAMAENLQDKSLDIGFDNVRSDLVWKNENDEAIMFPIFCTTVGVLVNEDIFKKEGLKVPGTYPELKETIGKLKAAGYENPLLGYDDKDLFFNIAYSRFIVETSRYPERIEALNSLAPSAGEYLREILEFVDGFTRSGCIDLEACEREIPDNYSGAILRFFEGDVPMLVATGDLVSGTAKREALSESFQASPFVYKLYPFPTGENGAYFYERPNICFSVNKESKNLEIANEFMRFLSMEDELVNISKEKRLIATTKSIAYDEVFSALNDIPDEYYASELTAGLLDNSVVQVKAAMYYVGTGQMTVDEAVAAYGTME